MISPEHTTKAIQKLTHIGFTQLESEIYLYLLSHGVSTGYAIAKGIGKATANVYKATESLVRKGGIEQTMDESKLYIAVSWKLLLADRQKEFTTNINSLSECLNHYPEYQVDENVYQLRKMEQVIEQTLRMIEQAKHIILADIEPDVINWLALALVQAAKRGVEVRVKVYQAIELEGVYVTYRLKGEEVYAKTNDINFTVSSDGQELMMALFNENASTVIQAFRTTSALMNMRIYCGLLYELILTDLKIIIPQGNIQSAQKILTDTEHLHPFSNKNCVFQAYRQRYGNKRLSK
ncbi:MAG: hypothetical protein COB35_03605 [Gammaproteobacteria bacterium]|nr:MAG: hypothetical protein COB35_03605 [Gammaproteobacteria bacterium]